MAHNHTRAGYGFDFWELARHSTARCAELAQHVSCLCWTAPPKKVKLDIHGLSSCVVLLYCMSTMCCFHQSFRLINLECSFLNQTRHISDSYTSHLPSPISRFMSLGSSRFLSYGPSIYPAKPLRICMPVTVIFFPARLACANSVPGRNEHGKAWTARLAGSS